MITMNWIRKDGKHEADSNPLIKTFFERSESGECELIQRPYTLEEAEALLAIANNPHGIYRDADHWLSEEVG